MGFCDIMVRDQSVVLLNMLYDEVDWQLQEAFRPVIRTIASILLLIFLPRIIIANLIMMILNISLVLQLFPLFLDTTKIWSPGIKLNQEILFPKIRSRLPLTMILENTGNVDFLIGDLLKSVSKAVLLHVK